MDPRQSLETRPKHVAIVALGPSFHDFIRESIGRKNQNTTFDEVWTVNRGCFGFRHDKVFLMDDLKWMETHDDIYSDRLKRHDKPIITCYAYPDYPMSVEYPLGPVIGKIGDDLLNNTVAYAIAYAFTIGVQTISLYGADYYYPDVQAREEGSQAVSYLLGMARAFGCKFRLPQTTTILGAHTMRMDAKTNQLCRPLYGYHRRQELKDLPTHPFIQHLEEMRAAAIGGEVNLAGGAHNVSTQGPSLRQDPRQTRPDGAEGNHALSAALLRAGTPGIREEGGLILGERRGNPSLENTQLVPRGSGEGHQPEGDRGNGLEQAVGQVGQDPSVEGQDTG